MQVHKTQLTQSEGISEGIIAIPGETLYFVRCECDNSTPAGSVGSLPHAHFVAIYTELRNLALANLERGEIA
jgi:hypothetical protein